MEAATDDEEPQSASLPPRLAAWIWQPWYAKLWWTAIPVWWAGMAIATMMGVLESFYRGGIAGYLHILFFPMTALMVLGVGYVRERFHSFVGRCNGMPPSDEDATAFFANRSRDELARTMEGWRAMSDPMDPRSGPFWIGSSMNPNNPAYIDPTSGKHL